MASNPADRSRADLDAHISLEHWAALSDARTAAAGLRKASLVRFPRDEESGAVDGQWIKWAGQVSQAKMKLTDLFSELLPRANIGIPSEPVTAPHVQFPTTNQLLLGILPDHLIQVGIDALFLRDSAASPTRGELLPPDRLEIALIAVRTRALRLAAWVEQEMDALVEAVWPRIHVIQSGDTYLAEVRLAGTRRRQSLTYSQGQFLIELKQDEEASSLRKVKMSFARDLPELSPFIQATGHRAPGLDQNQSIYRLDPRARERITIDAR